MAKKQEQSLTKTDEETALAQYAGTGRGMEDITPDQVTYPRLALAQGLSPELMEAEPAYIPGLKNGDMFNSITRMVYGKGPLEFTLVKSRRRYVEFVPREQGGGVKDPNVPHGDPRTKFGEDGEHPIATQFRDYVIVLIPSMEVVVMSMKGWSIKVSNNFNTQMRGLSRLHGGTDSFRLRFELSSMNAKNSKGTFAVFRIVPSTARDEHAGKQPGFVSDEIYRFAEAVYRELEGKELVVERDEAGEDADDAEGDDKPQM